MENLVLQLKKYQSFLIVGAVIILAVFSYWFVSDYMDQARTAAMLRLVTAPSASSLTPSLPPPQLTAEERVRIQASITASGTEKISETRLDQILNTLTAPKK